ncbi:MAG: hypothetical protein ACOCM4_00085 [Acetivibrio ethanolgignens]
MKRIVFYVFSFFLAVGVLTGAYYYSYQKAAKHARENTNIIEAEQIKEADTRKQDIVWPDTECVLEIYDKGTGQQVKGKLLDREDILGKNREELIEYLSAYMEELPLEEFQKGLLSYELLSFSADRIVLRKTYDSGQVGYEYYIAVFDNEVVVYYSDKKTVYEYTGISVTNLPEIELRKLNYGIYVKNQEELYGILENYSS